MSYNYNTNMYEGYIYSITNLLNGKIYIGQTRATIRQRFQGHCVYERAHGSIIDLAIKKYGKDNFKVDEICKFEFSDIEDLKKCLNEKEQFYILYYNSKSPNGYNITNGGDTISQAKKKCVVSYEIDGTPLKTFEACIDASTYYGLHYNGAGQCALGHIIKCRTKKTQSGFVTFRYEGHAFDEFDINKYKKIKYVYMFDLDGNYIKRFDNVQDVLKEFKYSNTANIEKSIKNKTTSFGYYFSYSKVFDFDINNYRCRISVDKYSMDGEYIDTYKSMFDAALSVNENPRRIHGISSSCKGIRGSAHGYVWRFHNEPFDKYKVKDPRNKVVVDQYDINGNFIQTHQSMGKALEAVNHPNANIGSIRKVCEGKQAIGFGYIWRYHNEPFDKYPINIPERYLKNLPYEIQKVS